MMDNHELRQHIVDDLLLIDYDIASREGEQGGVFFDDIDNGSLDGEYLFIRDNCFYYGVIERGIKRILAKKDSLKDFLFYFYSPIVGALAWDYACSVDMVSICKERIKDVKQLELLGIIDEAYRERRRLKLIELIQDVSIYSPEIYNDDLGTNLDLSLLDRVTPKMLEDSSR